MSKKLKPLTSFDQIVHVPALKLEPMDIHSWGITGYVRELRADEAGIWRDINASIEAGQGFSVDNVIDLVMLTLCDEHGTRICTTPEHRKELAGKSWVTCQAIFLKALAVGRMSAAGVETEKKDLSETPSDVSNID